jgi:hypothetical protein
VTRHHERAARYLDALEHEMALHVEVIGRSQSVSQLHFGGGTPTFLSDDEFSRLMASLRKVFKIGSLCFRGGDDDATILLQLKPFVGLQQSSCYVFPVYTNYDPKFSPHFASNFRASGFSMWIAVKLK